jgi:hypothetical protein
MRQQRTNNARGTISPLTLPRPDVLWTLALLNGTTVEMFPNALARDMIVTGILQLRYDGNATFPTAMTRSGDQFLFTFVGPLVPGQQFTLQPNDPAVRTVWGGYVSGGIAKPNPFGTITVVNRVTTSGPIAGYYNQAYGGGAVDFTLPIPLKTSEEYVVGASGLDGTTANIKDNGGGAVQAVATGEVWSVSWNGAAWVPFQQM